jgi:2-dehydro-3-deoxyphosphogluconate aldolase/(4S)-4-hydroxy-2-oxoglutarate aldolase
VRADNIGAWLTAGSVAVGAGSDLCSPKAMTEGRWDEIQATAETFTAALAAARSGTAA